MLAKWMVMNRRPGLANFASLMLARVAPCLLWGVVPASTQDQSQSPPPDNTQNNGKPKQDVPPDAGGPTGDVGPYAIPKKNHDEGPPPPPPPASTPKVEGMPDYSIKVNVPLVNVDVMVTTKSGQFIPGLKKDNFRLFEDGAQQQIASFNVTKAPITAVLLVGFGATRHSFMIDALRASS